jgi:hypothetical protein
LKEIVLLTKAGGGGGGGGDSYGVPPSTGGGGSGGYDYPGGNGAGSSGWGRSFNQRLISYMNNERNQDTGIMMSKEGKFTEYRTKKFKEFYNYVCKLI